MRFGFIVTTIKGMEITFDPKKDALNIRRHGISLQEAGELEWDTAIVREDNRYPYDEVRWLGLGYIGLFLYYVVFVDQGGTLRIISLRKATNMEMKKYAKA